MADRVRSDHPSVLTVRGRIVRRGGTRRSSVSVPPAHHDVLPAESTVRLILDGRTYHASLGSRGESRTIVGVYDNARRARERDGTDRLAEWIETAGLDLGRSVLIDVVVPGEVYGLRAPGEDVTYEAGRGPGDSLRRIAEDLGSGT